MNIDIAQKLRPFSHKPGTYVVLPGSHLSLQAFPTRFIVYDLSDKVPQQKLLLSFSVTGPVDEFTIQQDLEKGSVSLWGHAREGFFRFRIRALMSRPGVEVTIEKLPEGSYLHNYGWDLEESVPLVLGGTYVFSSEEPSHKVPFTIPTKVDQLSLGSHKGQDWELLARRENFTEIFPLWHRLGQMVLSPKSVECPLLIKCEKAIAAGDSTVVLSKFREVFLTCFDGIMTPRLHDLYFHGIDLEEKTNASSPTESNESPLALLSQGAALIRSLFIQVTHEIIALLPVAPPEFHAGRLVGTPCGDWGVISFEWTKKAVRRVILTVYKDTTVTVRAKSDQKSCRMRLSTKDRGRIHLLGTPVTLVAGSTYWFDNFQK